MPFSVSGVSIPSTVRSHIRSQLLGLGGGAGILSLITVRIFPSVFLSYSMFLKMDWSPLPMHP